MGVIEPSRVELSIFAKASLALSVWYIRAWSVVVGEEIDSTRDKLLKAQISISARIETFKDFYESVFLFLEEDNSSVQHDPKPLFYIHCRLVTWS